MEYAVVAKNPDGSLVLYGPFRNRDAAKEVADQATSKTAGDVQCDVLPLNPVAAVVDLGT